jgi:hypothetical protein
MVPSRARREVRRLHDQIGALLETLVARSPLFAASLYEHTSQCGNPQCKCARTAYRHRQVCVSFVDAEGRSRTRTVPRALRGAVGELTAEYARVRRARREVQRLFERLLAAADALGRARCEAGAARYARLAAGARAPRGRRGPREGGR